MVIPTAEIKLEGTSVRAVLSTDSPVTIVFLKFLFQVLAENKPKQQTPEEWKTETRKRLKEFSLLAYTFITTEEESCRLWARFNVKFLVGTILLRQ